MKLLLAEDEESLSEALSTILERYGYEVDAVGDGEAALEHMRAESYDAAVLDIMMPKMDGIEVLKNVRESGNLTPVLMLTAKSEIDDKVMGLQAGANDYLTKPFNSKELIARIEAMTRAQSFQNHPKLSLGNVTIDRESLELSTPTGALRLASREFRMLELLMSNPKSRISSERFLEKLWKGEEDADAESVQMYISYLKNKLESLHADIRITKNDNSEYGLMEVSK